MKAVLIRKSTQEVIKRGQYPNRKMNPIKGLDADLEWLLVVYLPNPSYDPSTHKLVQTYTITDTPHTEYPHINTYEIGTVAEAMATQEIVDYIQKSEDDDDATISHIRYKEDGVQFLDRVYAIILRKEKKGTITANQAKGLINGLYDSLEPLYKGLWQLVKVNLAEQKPPNNARLLAIFNAIKNKVDNYVNANY
jgi:hypothetical protein